MYALFVFLLHADDDSCMIKNIYGSTTQLLSFSAQVTYLILQTCQLLQIWKRRINLKDEEMSLFCVWLSPDVSYSDECQTKMYFQYAKILNCVQVL